MTNKERLYCFLIALFSTLVVVGNITYQKFVSISPFVFHEFQLSVGAILYPMTFAITDLIAEFYGKKRATFCVRLALVMNIITALIIYFMDHLQALEWSRVNDQMFHHVFGMYGVAFLGSLLACYISQSLDVFLYLMIKRLTKDKFIWIRNLVSTSISLFLDTCFVITFMAIFGIFEWTNLLTLIKGSYSFKLFFTILNIPMFYLYVLCIRKFLSSNANTPSEHLE
jgi:uncharacterized integral membrane protein (TIGR00697 family)